MTDHKPVTIQIEVTLDPDLYVPRLGDRGNDDPTPEDVFDEIEDAIAQRFGGHTHPVWLNRPTTPDRSMECDHGCGEQPHRWRPSWEAGPHWRCSVCGEVTESSRG